MPTKYPSNRTDGVETRGGSRSVRPTNVRQFMKSGEEGGPRGTHRRGKVRTLTAPRPWIEDRLGRPVGNADEFRRFSRALLRVGARTFGRKLTGPIDWFETGLELGRGARRLYDQWLRERRVKPDEDLVWFPITPQGGGGGPFFGNFAAKGWTADGIAPSRAPGQTTMLSNGDIATYEGWYSYGRVNDPFDTYQFGFSNQVQSSFDTQYENSATHHQYNAEWVGTETHAMDVTRYFDSATAMDFRYHRYRAWQRNGAPQPDNVPVGGGVTRPMPLFEVPFPLPARFGEPWNQPSEPEFDHRVPQVLRLPNFGPPLVEVALPDALAQVLPQADTTVIVGNEVTTRPGKPRDRRRPRSPLTREIKVRLRGRLAFVWLAINFVTETFDFVDVLYDGIPKKYRKKGALPDEKAVAVWEHLDKIDGAKAVENYLNNAVEDYVYGKLSPDRQLNQLTSKPTGGAASFGTRTHTGQQFGETVAELIPTLEFDVQTGAWRLSTPVGDVGMTGSGRLFRS